MADRLPPYVVVYPDGKYLTATGRSKYRQDALSFETAVDALEWNHRIGSDGRVESQPFTPDTEAVHRAAAGLTTANASVPMTSDYDPHDG
jgi:hypothetical protein